MLCRGLKPFGEFGAFKVFPGLWLAVFRLRAFTIDGPLVSGLLFRV